MFNLKSLFSKKSAHDSENRAPETKWWSFNLQESFNRLYASENGLTSEEVEKRQDKHGPNLLPQKTQGGVIDILKDQIKSAMIVVLFVAAVISFLLGDAIDGFIILLAVVINIIVGFWQEFRTFRALEALQKVVVSYSSVLRDGDEKLIKTKDLVPGDIILLKPGDKVPADVRLLKVNDLKINEAILTGESEPRDKQSKILDSQSVLADRTNMAFMGTIVVSGSAHGLVVETGINTQIGRIAELVAGVTKEETPLQKKLDGFAISLTKIILLAAGLIFILGLFFGHSFREMFVTSVAVAVSAIPEGLAVTVIVVLAVGMKRILKHKALVRRLLGAETLGSTSVICADKTGTITEGKMRVVKIITEDSQKNEDGSLQDHQPEIAEDQLFLLRIGVLCNDAYMMQTKDKLKIDSFVGNLTERALLLVSHQMGLDKKSLEKEHPRLDEIPFDSLYKFMITLNKFDEQNNIVCLKGAPEKVLLFSNYVYSHSINKHLELNDYRRDKIIKTYEDMSKQGLRVLAIGYKKVDKNIKAISDKINLENQTEKQSTSEMYTNFVFVGLVGIKDPIRDNVKETIEQTKQAGIETIMITGDNKFTARVIAHEIGLNSEAKNILEGSELEKMSNTEFKNKVKDIKIYARVTPAQKLRIVKAWQEEGRVVAMTGDGINDAPALKQADMGIALGTATDVAKEAADMVLLDNNFKTIVEAVKQGRIIFANIKKIILYFLSDSFTEVTAIIVALILKWPLPLLASQIIWVNLINDTFPALALTQDPSTGDVMQRGPERKDAGILDREHKTLIGLISLVSALFILFSFWIFWHKVDANLELGRTLAFCILGGSSLLYIFSVRNLNRPIWKTKLWSNKFLLLSLVIGGFLQAFAVYNPFLQNIFETVPLSLWHWLYIILVCFVIIGLIELVKWLFNKYHWDK